MADVLLLETGDRVLLEDGVSALLLEIQTSGQPDVDTIPNVRFYDLDARRTYRRS
jgi:hypothetical protein